MVTIPGGVYAISRRDEQLVTMEGGNATPGTPVFILPPIGSPGEQEWMVEVLSNGNVLIKNLKSGTYMSYDGDPEVNKPVGGYPEPREWMLCPTPMPFTFHVVVPGGPGDGGELVFDSSLLRIFPPRTALRPFIVEDLRQAWTFQFHE